ADEDPGAAEQRLFVRGRVGCHAICSSLSLWRAGFRLFKLGAEASGKQEKPRRHAGALQDHSLGVALRWKRPFKLSKSSILAPCRFIMSACCAMDRVLCHAQ